MYDNLIKHLKRGFLPPEIRIPYFGFVLSVIKGIGMKDLFDKIEKPDNLEIIILIALEVEEIIKKGEEKTKKEIARVIRSLLEENLKNYRLETKKDYWGGNTSWHKDTRDWEIALEEIEKLSFDPGSSWKCSISAKEQDKCGVPGCEKNGTYIDKKYKKICHNHERYVALKRKKGQKDPYEGIEDGFEPNYKKRRPFQDNHGFWQFVKSQISEEEWGQIWKWAKGRKGEMNSEILEKIRKKITEAMSGQQNLKKRGSIVFVDLVCQRCGNKFEFDLLQKTKNNVEIPTLCQNCGGKNYSKRIYRAEHVLKRLRKGEITRDNVASILGYHPQRVGKLRKILEKQGIKGLGAKLQDPFFKQT